MHLLLYAPFITIKEKTGQIYIHSLPTQQMGGEMSVLKLKVLKVVCVTTAERIRSHF